MTFTAIELCAGAGGMSLGVEAAGFDNLALIEKDLCCCATLSFNKSIWNVMSMDLRKFTFRYWEYADLICGGLPCPPYSVAGRQLGSEDERDLFPTMLDIVEGIKPKALLIENVPGLLGSKFSKVREYIKNTLKAAGFKSCFLKFDAADFGVPQHRLRVFLLAFRNDIDVKNFKKPEPLGKEYVSVGNAIKDLISVNGWKKVEEWVSIACRPAPTILLSSGDLGPSGTKDVWFGLGVDGSGIADRAPSQNFEGLPRLTYKMLAKLQGFPEDWHFLGNKGEKHKQIGNALPPQLAEAVLKSVAQCLDKGI